MSVEFGSAGVAGAGTMGLGIAISIARAGIPTVIADQSADVLARAKTQISDFFSGSVAKGKLSEEKAAAALKGMSFVTDLAALSDLDVVVEAIYEDLGAKTQLLGTLDRLCSDKTLFLTNTSTLSITELAAGSGRPDRVVGAHYCLPAQIMKLVEMSRGIHTSQESWDMAWRFEALTGQLPIETKDRPGFVLNHFCVPYHNDVIRMIEAEVTQPADIDRAMKAALGFAMGPCELLDMIGLDTQLRVSEAIFASTNNPRTAPPPLLRRMVAAGQLGRKTQQGFYSYERNAMYGG